MVSNVTGVVAGKQNNGIAKANQQMVTLPMDQTNDESSENFRPREEDLLSAIYSLGHNSANRKQRTRCRHIQTFHNRKERRKLPAGPAKMTLAQVSLRNRLMPQKTKGAWTLGSGDTSKHTIRTPEADDCHCEDTWSGRRALGEI